MAEYEATIGLEVHVELNTDTKIFCSCSTGFGAEPNTNICPVCCGYPGALPVLGEGAVELAVRAGLALGCKINKSSWFDRKNYFYPDLPKGYQITQYEMPICSGGGVPIFGGERVVGLERIHLEEDAAKLIHRGDKTLIDYNRSGVPLIEIVGKPEMHTAEEAKEYLTSLRRILSYIGVSDCRMNEGSMRCDINVSVSEKGSGRMGVKCEIKNVNSVNYAGRAINDEIARQREVLESGGVIEAVTRRFNEDTGRCETMRKKEGEVDYRYFTEPDLPVITLDESYIEEIRRDMPPLPDARMAELEKKYNLKRDDAYLLTSNRFVTEYFIRCMSSPRMGGKDGKSVAPALFISEIYPLVSDENSESYECEYVSPDAFGEICRLFGEGKLVSGNAKKLVHLCAERDESPAAIAENENLLKISDVGTISGFAKKAIAENDKAANDYLDGKVAALKTLIGYVMRESRGQADPKTAEELLEKLLSDSEK